MTLKEFLEKNPIIQKMELADLMYPHLKSSRTKLSNKLTEREVGSGKQRILDKDVKEAIRVLEDLKKNIDEFIISYNK